jgi:hypothetical protein
VKGGPVIDIRAIRAPFSGRAARRQPKRWDPGPETLPAEAEYSSLRFAIDLVDRLAAEHGFDPAELVSPRTHESLEPLIDRIRATVDSFEKASGRDAPGRDQHDVRPCRKEGKEK